MRDCARYKKARISATAAYNLGGIAWPTSVALNRARASGGFSTIGISFQRASCFMRWAMRLRPFATTTGADIVSGRYSSATA